MPKKKQEESSEIKVLEQKDPEELTEKEVEKLAEAESTILENSVKEKKKKILEKLEKLKGKVDVAITEDLKEKVKIKKRTDMLIPLEYYVKTGIYLGTRAVTPTMKPFVYRRRADGLAIFNTDIIDEKLKEAIEYISTFEPNEIVVACKRQAGWRAVNMFSKLTGIKVFTKKYPAGVLTNTTLSDFFENELTIITDSWLDKNALHDTLNVHKKVLLTCDTNNFSKGADKIIIGNNKSGKSLGVIFYLLAKGYCKAKEIDADIPDLDWWLVEDESEKPVEKKIERTERSDARWGV
jgi:small subunit ribosomal protein S2